jgi:hypothetical protein
MCRLIRVEQWVFYIGPAVFVLYVNFRSRQRVCGGTPLCRLQAPCLCRRYCLSTHCTALFATWSDAMCRPVYICLVDYVRSRPLIFCYVRGSPFDDPQALR